MDLKSRSAWCCGVAGWWLATLLVATSAFALDPSPANSTSPGRILLVGHDGSTPDPIGAFSVTVRGIDNLPIPDADVLIDFSGAPVLTLSTLQLHPGMTVTACSPAVVMATTDALGVATFNIIGGIGAHPQSGIPPGGCFVSISARSGSGPTVLLASGPAAALDLNGFGGVDADDLRFFLFDFSTGSSCLGDYNGDRQTSVADVSILESVIASKRSTQSGVLCVGGGGDPPLVQTLALTLSQETVDCNNPASSQFSTSTCAAGKRTDWLCSVTLPAGADFTDLTGVEATIDVYGTPGSDLPGFYLFGAGQCHQGALTGIPAIDPGGEPNCLAASGALDVRGGESFARANLFWPHPDGGATDQARIVATNTVAFAPVDGVTCRYGSVSATVPTPILGFRIANNGSVCATSTCAAPVAFVLKELRLTSMSPSDLGLSMACSNPSSRPRATAAQPTTMIIRPAAGGSNVVYVNGVPPGLVLDVPGRAPASALAAPAPNPFSSQSVLHYQVAREGLVRIAVYDVAGRVVRVLLEESRPPGSYSIAWDGRETSGARARAGTYFCRLSTDGISLSKPLIRVN